MNKIQNLVTNLLVIAVASAMVSSLAAQTPQQIEARVIRIKGSARFTTGNNVWQPLKIGASVKPGTVIQTGMDAGSYVDLVVSGGEAGTTPVIFNPSSSSSSDSSSAPPINYESKATQSIIRITENTLLGIDKLTSVQTGSEEVSDTQLDLKAGRILGNVKKLSTASRFEIKLPDGVAGIRGTCFDISATGPKKCFIGSFVFAKVDEKTGNVSTIVISGGQGYDSQSNQVNPLSPSDMSKLGAEFNDMAHGNGKGPPTSVPVGNPGRENVPVSPHAPGTHP